MNPQIRSASIAPKNGAQLVAMVAGGPPDLFRSIQRKLERRGVRVAHHADYRRQRDFQKAIPKDVDYVIVLTDVIAHSNCALVAKAAERAGVPYVLTRRKMANMEAALRKRGFVPLIRAARPRRPEQVPDPTPELAPEPDPTPDLPEPAEPAPESPPEDPKPAAIIEPEAPDFPDGFRQPLNVWLDAMQAWLRRHRIVEVLITQTDFAFKREPHANAA